MRQLITTKPARWMLAGLLLAGPLFAAETQAYPSQIVPTGTAKTTVDNRPRTDRVPLGGSQNQMMARNTTAKVETAPAKEQKTQDKKTIGRCWQRLMNTFREINLAHRNRTR